MIVPAAILLLAGCNATKYVPEGELMLKRNILEVDERSVPREELQGIIKQKPNKRILGVPFYLYLYNLRDPDHVMRKRMAKDSLCAVRNLERLRDGKRTRTCDRTQRPRNGEPPVILEEFQTDRSNEQIRMYMQKEGWFRATVSDSLHQRRKRLFGRGRGDPFRQPKADVAYYVTAGPMYRLRHIRFTVDDPRIEDYVAAGWSGSLLHAGDRFDADVLDQERGRISDRLKQLGYLYFNRELVQYDADTTVGNHQVDIVLRLERPYERRDRGLLGTPEGTVYDLGDVTIATGRGRGGSRPLLKDTLYVNGYRLLFDGSPLHKPTALLSAVFLVPGQRFSQTNADLTYRRLTSLRTFDRVEITYDTTGTRRPGLAHARIDLMPGRQQNLSFEGFGTNRGGNMGTSLSVGFRHRNLFRTLGQLQVQMVLGFEAQQAITGGGATTTEQTTGLNSSDGLFNTVDIGPEVTLRFPHFLLPVKRERFSRSASPSTLFTALYNYQRRPDFARTLAKLSFGYEWQETRTKTWALIPIEVNVVRIPEKSTEFENYLRTANDPVLTDSYTDHLIAGMRGLLVLNTQSSSRQRNTFYARLGVEWAGHPLFLPLGWISQEATDTSGNRFNTVGGIRYAEFVKVDADLRWHHNIHDKSSMAFRVTGGVGVPYGNLPVLPFESSFFVGGANGLRAWRARSLGPGNYRAPLLAFDRIGEVRIEGNVEYRFKLISYVEGALFADAGNIWLLNEDPRKPGSGFSARFVQDLAIGTGAGIRLNFDFFILRFDLGLQTKDPSLPQGERWVFQSKDTYLAGLAETSGGNPVYKPQVNLNLGIGYPF